MKALILNGLDIESEVYPKIKVVVNEKLKKLGYQRDWIDLSEKRIEYCTGCSYCSKKPGICATNDDMQEIFPKMANSEFLVLLCSVSFGGYNSELKKVVDRYSVLGLPTYTIYKGELHHPVRYSMPNLFMAIGVLNENNIQQRETFELVSERTAISCFASKAATIILNLDQDKWTIKEKLNQGFVEME